MFSRVGVSAHLSQDRAARSAPVVRRHYIPPFGALPIELARPRHDEPGGKQRTTDEGDACGK